MTTKIEWTDETYNPVTGCSKTSPGCKNCYAERLAPRFKHLPGYDSVDPFKVTLHPGRLEQPLRWRNPRRVFVCSMGDLFHEKVPDGYIAAVFGVMAFCHRHTFQVLTKRPARALAWFDWVDRIDGSYQISAEFRCAFAAFNLGVPLNPSEEFDFPPPNVWFGVTTEDQPRADERIALLLQIPAAKLFVSYEPGLSEVNIERGLAAYDRMGEPSGPHPRAISWVIAGGENGPGARPMHPDWARSLRDQCQEAGVSFFFKGHGGARPPSSDVLDGRTWKEFPG